MKCLNCGCENDRYLCDACTTAGILDKVFNEIRFYKPEACKNPYLAEYTSGLTEKYAERDLLPVILDYFDFEIAEYYYCQYFRMRRDSRFEETAAAYLQTHMLTDVRSQQVLYDLVESYIPNEFIKPKKWCETIAASDDFYCDTILQ